MSDDPAAITPIKSRADAEHERLTRLKGDDLETELRSLAKGAVELAQAEISEATLRAYTSQFKRFAIWCTARHFESLPTQVEVVSGYIHWMNEQGLKVPTVMQALAAIAYVHREHDMPWDSKARLLLKTVEGFRNTRGVRPKKKAPVLEVELRKLLGTCGDDLIGLRDRAIILVGWWGAFRRSEIVKINVDDVEFTEQGLFIVLRRSKRDQVGAGYEKGLWRKPSDRALCPEVALRAWLEASHAKEGPIFRALGRGAPRWGPHVGERIGARLSDKSVARLIKTRAKMAGLDATRFSGHSLRAGFVTTAAEHDRSLDLIMRQTGHTSEKIVMGYIRHATVFTKNATKGLLESGDK